MTSDTTGCANLALTPFGRINDEARASSYYRARYYDPQPGRLVSEDPIGYKAGMNFYRYVRNNAINLTDPSGLYTLQGFSPAQAAEMTIAIGQLWAKLSSNPCCIDPKTRDRVLNLLQPGNYGSGVTFVYKQTLPADPGFVTCAEVTPFGFFGNKVEISQAALDGTCRCSLAGTLLHEITHLTWGNHFGPTPEGGAYGNASSCFGANCSMPRGLGRP